MEGCAMDKILPKIRSEWDQAFRVYQDVNESHFRSLESLVYDMTREVATNQDMLREVLRRMERLERANNFQAMNGKLGEGQTVYIVDGSVNNFQQQNGNPATCDVQLNPCPNPTPSPAEGLEQPKDMGVAQQETSSTNNVSHQGHQKKVSQPNQRGLAFGTPSCSGESLQHLVEAAEIHGARAKAAAANSSQQGLESEVTCSGGQDVVYSRDNVTSTMRNRKCRVEEIPTSQTVTIYDGDHTYLREPVVQSDSSNKFFCTYCPRQFQHKHSRSLHIRSCKKKHEDAMKRLKAVEPQDNGNESCSDLAIHGSTPKKVGEILKKKIAKMIKCGHCERTFPTQHQVNSHERVHTGDRPFSCYICNIKFAHGGNMIKHIKSKHPASNPYVCRHCTSTFKTNLEIQNHRRECNPARNGVIRRRILESSDSSDGSFDSRNNEREVPRHESEDTATASESEDSGSSQDRQLVPMATTNPGYSNFTPQPVPMLEIKFEPNLNDANNAYNDAYNANEAYNANDAYNANESYNANNAYPNGAFHTFPLGSSIRHAQYTATQTYQCQSATGSPLVREIKVELCQTQTTSMPMHFPCTVPVPSFDLSRIKQELLD